MISTKDLVRELNKYPDDLKWYVVIDEDEGGLLVSEYTGDIANAQVAIVCSDGELDHP